MRFAYVILSYLLAPVAFGFLLWRGLSNRAYWRRLGERLGYGECNLDEPSIWVHAVSVGEVQAATALVKALRERYPRTPIVLTTVTPTGLETAQAKFGDSVCYSYAPYDLPGAVRRFFDRVRPKLAIILETELWPNLYHECGRRQVPLVLASARISPRSVHKYRRLFNLFREALSHGIVIAAQSEKDAERFRSLGANPDRTHVTGNIKFDFELPATVAEEGRKLRATQATGRPVWIAASTHEAEEEQVLDAAVRLRSDIPDALLMLVPRHPVRFGAVAALLRARGLAFVTRSSGGVCDAATPVFLGDSLGELPVFYAAADVAFVGGSLVPIGGHNLLEPAALALPVLTGPYNFNAEEIAALLVEHGAARIVRNHDELAAGLLRYFRDPALRTHDGNAGLEVVRANRGALERLIGLVDPLI
ncbi:MAG: lipid IV(A) 3-deoxy-D-manno-octulosonic acid transferase [Gammaproteobacteria bacterium]